MTASVLFVCTGNVCRSPAAERAFAQRFPDSWGLSARSAGTTAVVGAPIHESMRSVLDDRGIPTTPFAARQLTEAQVASSRLILTMTLEQRSAVVALSPAAARRTFTVLELASLVTDAPELGSRMPAARLDEVLAWAGSHRGIQVLHHADRELEIADPLGHGMAAFVAAYEQIDTAIARLALALSATL